MNEDKKKCDKYEAFFVFQNEEAFNNHIKECPSCAQEHEKYMKVSKLLKEVAPIYLKKREQKKFGAVKKLACCFLLFVGITASYTGYNMYNDYTAQTYWSEDTSYISNIGLPVDEYGFLEL